MSSMSHSASGASNALSNNPTGTSRPHRANSVQYTLSDDDDDIIIVDSSDYSPRLSVENIEVHLERKLLEIEKHHAQEVEALREEVARLKGVIAKAAVATESAMICDVLHASSHKVFILPCGHVFSQRALHDHFVATVKFAVQNNHRIPANMQQPPYTLDALQLMYRRHIQWSPACPICHRRIPAPPREVRKMTHLAKAIRELTAGDLVPHAGVDVHDEPMWTNFAAQWEEFFNLRRK